MRVRLFFVCLVLAGFFLIGAVAGYRIEPTGRVTGKQTPHGPGRCTCTKGECACCPGCVGHKRAK